jgi:hypothetical membrane protein
MNYDSKKIAGSLILVGAAQYILAVIVSEALYSGYSVGQQVMSDLGDWSKAGNSAAVFDVSVVLLGMLTLASAYFIQRTYKNRLFSSLFVITGVCAIGVGIVAENIYLPLHTLFAMIVFIASAATAFMSFKFEKSPLSHISVILGAVILLAFVLLFLGAANSGFWLGLGKGGMERFIIYPALLWMLGFGAHLIGEPSESATTSKA